MKRIIIIVSPILAVLLIALVLFIFLRSQSSHPIGANPQYHVDGKQILDNTGNTFIPYGVQLDGILLAQTNWRTDGALAHLTYDQVLAAHDFWHSNTVSLQIGSKALFDQSPYDSEYLSAIDQTVKWTNQLGMNIILVLQYEGHGNSFQPMPTHDSIDFWNILSKHYASNPTVFFDIFNEPSLAKLLGGSNTDEVWSFWQNGGIINNKMYVGFQQLIDTIRMNGAKNLVFADGLSAGEDIKLLPQHMLSGSNIVYAIHPYLNATQHHSEDDWDRFFGKAATEGNFPVVADEWSEYQSDRGECISDASTVVPRFLAYLKNHNIGLIAYALFPGLLIRGWDFRNPTAFDEPINSCHHTPIANFDSKAQGIGKLFKQYLAQNSIQNAIHSPSIHQ